MSKVNVPNEILRVFKSLYPEVHPGDVSWTWEVPGKIYEASFSLKKKTYEVEITVTGHHLLTEVVSKDPLPKAVQETLEKRYPNHTIDSTALVTFSNGDVYYEIDLVSATKKVESEVLIREDGAFVMRGEDL